MANLIKKFSEISTSDAAEVGGKNASLGELISKLSHKGIQVPDGFATTASAFRMFLNENKLEEPLKELMHRLDKKQFSNLKTIGNKARKLILHAGMPQKLRDRC